MKINRINDVTKLIIFAATVITICVLCALGFKMANEGKSAVTSGTKKYNDMASKQMSTDISVYDGSTVLGSELQRIIKQTIDSKEYLSIRVITGSIEEPITTHYNYTFDENTNKMTAEETVTEVPYERGMKGYINPDVQFQCTLLRDSNDDAVACMVFKQLK